MQGFSKHSWGLCVALHPNSDRLEDAAVVVFEPNTVEKYGIDGQEELVNSEIYMPLLVGEASKTQNQRHLHPKDIHGLKTFFIIQVVRLLGVENVYMVNGRHGAKDGPAHSFPICALEVLYFLNATCSYGIFPCVDDITAVIHFVTYPFFQCYFALILSTAKKYFNRSCECIIEH